MTLKKDSDRVELLKQTSLIIWDEVPMHCHVIEAVDRTLRDILDKPNCQGTTVWITGQFWDHLQDQLRGHLHGHLIDHLPLISDSISNPISGQLCDHRHDCPCDCLYNCLVDHLQLITSKLRDQLRDQLRVPNSDITEAQDPGLGLRQAMAKDRRVVCSLIIQCCTTRMYILMVSLMMGP